MSEKCVKCGEPTLDPEYYEYCTECCEHEYESSYCINCGTEQEPYDDYPDYD